MRRPIIVALSFLLLATSLTTAAPPRDDDFDFAQGLVARKYYDLAKEQFEKIISEATSTNQKANGELGLALLLKAQVTDIQGERDRETKEVLDLFAAAEKKFDAFLTTYSNHPKKTEAQFEVGNLLRLKGTYLTRKLEDSPANSEELRKTADEAFGQAIDLFRQVASSLEGGEPPGDKWWNCQKARYFYAVSNYDKALLFPDGSSERRGILDKAVELLDDFVWDNEQNILGGYAWLFYGLCREELDEPDDALELLATAASNYEVPEPPDYTVWSELFMQAYYKIGEYCNELGERGDRDYREYAIQQFKQMMDRLPDVWERKTGCFALLEYAKALAGLKQFDDAVKIVSKVSQKGEELAPTTEWGAAIAYQANKLLNEIIAEMGVAGYDVKLPPEDLRKAAMGKKTSRKWDEAVRAFQQVITTTLGTENENEFCPDAWLEVGECYYRDEKFIEAYYAYDHIVKTWPDLEIAGDAAYYRYRAATAMADATKDPRDLELKRKTRSEFAANYKDHPRSIDLQYYEAADTISDADSKRHAGDTDAAKPIYRQALQQLTGVKPTSILYAKARARMGEVRFQLGEYDKALSQFEEIRKYIDDPKNLTTDDERRLNRLQAQAIAAYYGARCYTRKEKWSKVLEELDGFETKYADENVANFHAPAKFERVRAYIESGALDAAEKQALDLRAQFEENPLTPFAYSAIGKAFQEAAAAAKERGDLETWRKMLEKAATYFAYYLGRKDNPTWSEWQTIGLWYRDLEDFPKAEKYLKRALQMVTEIIDGFRRETPEKAKLKKSQEGLLILLSEMLILQKKFGEAQEIFEELLIPDASARKRVFELLERQNFSQAALEELMQKTRAIPSLMEGLARTYIEKGGSAGVYLRALTLLKILSIASKDEAYTERWWNWKYLTCVAYFRYGKDYKERAAFDNLIKLIENWDNLGVLKNAPQYQDFNKLRTEADLERRKLGG